MFCYLVVLFNRLEQKQPTLSSNIFGKAVGPLLISTPSPQFAVNLFEIIVQQFRNHFPAGTLFPTVAATPTVSLGEDDEIAGGYIAVRVTNYQVTSLIRERISFFRKLCNQKF